MINAKELRIGNYLSYDKKIVFLAEILTVGVRMYDGYGFDKCTPFGCLRPIEITEEWLLKFGFEKTKIEYSDLSSNEVFTYKEYYCSIENGEKIVCKKFNREYRFIANVGTIHQLQNLYFALSGEELEEIKK